MTDTTQNTAKQLAFAKEYNLEIVASDGIDDCEHCHLYNTALCGIAPCISPNCSFRTSDGKWADHITCRLLLTDIILLEDLRSIFSTLKAMKHTIGVDDITIERTCDVIRVSFYGARMNTDACKGAIYVAFGCNGWEIRSLTYEETGARCKY